MMFSFKDRGLSSSRGFTLIEIAIGLLIIGLLVSGAAQLFYIYLVNQSNARFEKTVESVQSSLLDFTIDDPNDPNDAARYPCPASLTAARGTAGFGTELCPPDTNGNGIFADDLNLPGDYGTDYGGVFLIQGDNGQPVLVGTVPTSTLQISSRNMLDPYQNRMLYAVSLSHVETDAMLASPPPVDAVQVIDESGATNAVDFVLLSHGKDGAGSYTSEGVPNAQTCRTPPAGAPLGDAQNCSWRTTDVALFQDQVGHSLVQGNNDYYDDNAVYSLTSSGDDEGWWRATDNTNQDITHKNPGNILYGSGSRVGIGTNTPTAALDVAGAIKVGDETVALDADCVTATLGSTRYNRAADAMEYCAATGGVDAVGNAVPGWKAYGEKSVAPKEVIAGGEFNFTTDGTQDIDLSSFPTARFVSINSKCTSAHGVDVGTGVYFLDSSGTDIYGHSAGGCGNDFDGSSSSEVWVNPGVTPIPQNAVTMRLYAKNGGLLYVKLISGSDLDGGLGSAGSSPLANFSCPAGEMITGFADGTPVCGVVGGGIPSCPPGQTWNGTVCADTAPQGATCDYYPAAEHEPCDGRLPGTSGNVTRFHCEIGTGEVAEVYINFLCTSSGRWSRM